MVYATPIFGGAPVTEAVRDSFIQLATAYGSPNYTTPGHLCSQSRRLGLRLVYGGRTDPDYVNTKCMLIWAANPAASMRPAERFVYGKFNRVISEAKKRGAILIVIDPRRIKTAEKADIFVQIKPGTDAALALALINVINILTSDAERDPLTGTTPNRRFVCEVRSD